MAIVKTLLIVPCYNEALRLDLAAFSHELSEHVDVLFMDDGSVDETFSMLKKFCAENPRHMVFRSEKNHGKAEIIRLGYLSIKNSKKTYDWVGFWDADLATPLIEVQSFLTYQSIFCPRKKAIFGSRINRYGANVQRDRMRHYFSRAFVTLTDLFLGIKAYDSQCGAKLFAMEICDRAFGESFVSKWIFDLELILRVGAENIVEVPVQRWQDMPGSKVRIGRDVFRMAWDLLRIRGRYL